MGPQLRDDFCDGRSEMDEIAALTKRFKDYIDKVQSAYGQAQGKDLVRDEKTPVSKPSAKKLYTVVSPVEAMSSNLKSVLKAIDQAIDHIDELSQQTPSEPSLKAESKGVYSSSPGHKKFSDEELDFLVRTFNKILNTSDEERKRLFSQFDNVEKKTEG